MAQIHYLKSFPEYFEPTLRGEKRHELRSSSEGKFEVGDTLILDEFDQSTYKYTGRELHVRITYISPAKPWIPQGQVVMSIKLLTEKPVPPWWTYIKSLLS